MHGRNHCKMPGVRCQQLRFCMATVTCIVGIYTTSIRAEAPVAGGAAAYRVATEVVELTNAARVKSGRAPLRTNSRLMRAAQVHAEQMARAGHPAHVLPDAAYPRATDRLAAAGYHWHRCGENVALGQSSADEVVDDWMRSRGHRKNILSSDFTEVGAGFAIDRTGRPYYVQVFGSPSS